MSQSQNERDQRRGGVGPGIGPQGQQLESPKNVNLQFLDDTWERLLNAMERLEQVTEGFKDLTATRLDRHADRDEITEGEVEVRTEVHLQIMCLQRVVHPVRSEGQWMIEDFLTWFGGRSGRDMAPTDYYAVPILRCILGEPYELPPLDEVPTTKQDVLETTEVVARSLHETDKIEEKFRNDPDAEATQHMHVRGEMDAGLQRLAQLDPKLAADLSRPSRDSAAEPDSEPPGESQ